MKLKTYFSAAVMTALLVGCSAENKENAQTAEEPVEEITETVVETAPTQWMPDSVTVLPSGLGMVIENYGDTTKRASADTPVTLHYRGTLPNGQVFDSSYDRGEPATFMPAQVIPGFAEGIMTLGKGGKATLYIPSQLGYGEMGTPGGPIGPNQNLIFDIEIIDFPK